VPGPRGEARGLCHRPIPWASSLADSGYNSERKKNRIWKALQNGRPMNRYLSHPSFPQRTVLPAARKLSRTVAPLAAPPHPTYPSPRGGPTERHAAHGVSLAATPPTAALSVAAIRQHADPARSQPLAFLLPVRPPPITKLVWFLIAQGCRA
jgi:hypothetical protein